MNRLKQQIMSGFTAREASIKQVFDSFYGLKEYQREYNWEAGQLKDLVQDLTEAFVGSHSEEDSPKDVADYKDYFLGPIILKDEGGGTYNIIDGQQRLTSLLLMLIYLNHWQKEKGSGLVPIEQYIYQDHFGEPRFRLSGGSERDRCLSALFEKGVYEALDNDGPSVKNMDRCYREYKDLFAASISEETMPLFIHWLIHKVKLIEICTAKSEDAYKIFETMNDRGLSLTAAEMLKGFLISQITDKDQVKKADRQFKKIIDSLPSKKGKSVVADFFKSWFRAQYAGKYKIPRKGDVPGDYYQIGAAYHRWFRRNSEKIENGRDSYRFIETNLTYFGNLYKKLLEASANRNLSEGLEALRYNADLGFTIQYQALLAPLLLGDDPDTKMSKVRAVANFIDIWLNNLAWNKKTIATNYTKRDLSDIVSEIRHLSLTELRKKLREILDLEKVDFSYHPRYDPRTSKILHCQLARLADWFESASNIDGNYEKYVKRGGKNPFEIEHIWTASQFSPSNSDGLSREEFMEERHRIGGLVLLRKSPNASVQDRPYKDKLEVYLAGDGILAQSLHPSFYSHNPRVKKAVKQYGLNPGPHKEFKRKNLEDRSNFYCKIAGLVWAPERI